MATISSPGIGSGLDINSIVSQLVAVERKPIQSLQRAASDIQTQISAYGQVQSMLSAVRDAAAKLGQSTLWQTTSTSTSDASALTATSTGSASAAQHSVQVTSLAKAQVLKSGTFGSASTALGLSGALRIELGSFDTPPPTDPASPITSTFTASPADASGTYDITVAATDTLQTIRDKINAANRGVTASVVNTVGGAVLSIRSSDTGSSNAVRIRALDAAGASGTDISDGSGLAQLGYPPVGSPSSSMTQPQAATNAQLTVDSIAVQSASNTVTGVLDGVTLNLLKEGTTSTLTVSNDTASQRQAMDDFVKAYNTLNTYLAQQTNYDEATKKGGTLQADSAALSVRRQLRSVLAGTNTSSTATAFQSLNAVGFRLAKDGTMSIDSTAAANALAQPSEMSKLLANTDTSATTRGMALRLRDMVDSFTLPDGLVAGRADGLQTRLRRNQTDQAKLEDRVAQTQARLLRQYQALDAKMGQLNGLSSYVSQQMTALNNAKG